MEPFRVRDSLRRHCVRRLRPGSTRCAHAATADSPFDAAGENIFACLSYLCSRAELDLLAATLAQLLERRFLQPRVPTSALEVMPHAAALEAAATVAKSVSIRVYLWLS